MANDVNTDILLKGTGMAEHQRELMKILAAAGIKDEDLQNRENMELIQEVLADFIADDQIGADENDFNARLLFSGAQNQRRSDRNNMAIRGVSGHKTQAPPTSLKKQVTFS